MKLTAGVVEGFVGSVLSSRFDGRSESAPFHRECWELCTGPDRFVAIAAPRGHAKSTAVTLGYGIATLLFRERKFMVLVSDTETQASLFLGLFKSELQENKDLIELFDLKKNAKGEVAFIKDSETDIIVEFGDGARFRIMVRGSEQKTRGLIWDGLRPDIIMCDDIENDELVMNKERRDKFRRWFRNALLPCLSDRGIVRLVGTVLHMDSLLESLMPNPSDRFTVTEELKQYTTLRGKWRAVKYRAHNSDFSQLLWPGKKTMEWFKTEYAEAQKNGALDGYSQEYLNIPLDESVSFYRRNDFLPMLEEDKGKNMNHYITVDLAISESEKADYSVFVVCGVDEERVIYVKDVVRARMDGREIVDQLLFLQKAYNPVAIGIEEMQVSKAIGPFLNEEMVAQNTYISLVKLKPGKQDKPMRSRSIQARMRARRVKFTKEEDWYPAFEEELCTFPRGKNDDQADAFAYLGIMLDMLMEAPTNSELEDEYYQEELEKAGLNDSGRSSLTGY